MSTKNTKLYLFKKFIIFIALAASIASFFYIKNPLLNDLHQKIINFRIYSIPVDSKNIIGYFKNNLISDEKSTIYCYNSKGRQLWHFKSSINNPNFNSEGDYCVLNDLHNIEILNNNGSLVLRKTITSGIYNIKISKNNFSILTSNNNLKSLIIYDLKGSKIDEIKYPHELIVDFGDCNNNMFYTLCTEQNTNLPYSIITIFVPGGSVSGIINIPDQLINKVSFFNDYIIAIGNDRINCYDYNFNKKNIPVNIKGWKLVDTNTKGEINFLFTNLLNSNVYENTSLRLIDIDNNDIKYLMPVNSITTFLSNDKIFIITPDGYQSIGTDNKHLTKIHIPLNITAAVHNQNTNGIYVYSYNKVYYYSFGLIN